MNDTKKPKPSFLAAFLSLLFPGLGQVYLRTPFKGLIFFIGVAVGALLVYLNSLPLNNWRDLIRFEEAEKIVQSQKGEDGVRIDLEKLKETAKEIESKPHLRLYEDEERKLMFKPNWIIKITGFAQTILLWLWAILDGWSGERGTNVRALKRKLEEQHERYEHSGT